MDKPKISIILAVYNAQEYLKKSIGSLINQTFSDIEIIAVDDGSLDDSYKILQALAETDKRLKIFHIENGGPGVARQYGLDNATGQYIMFCDADDYFRSEMCSEMVDAIEQHNADWGICNLCIEGDAIPKHTGSLRYITYTKDSAPTTGVSLLCHIFRKEIIDRYKLIFPPVYYSEDLAFIFKYVYVSSSYFHLDKPLYVHFINKESLMETVSKNGTKLIKGLASYFDVADFLLQQNLWETYKNDFFCKLERALIATKTMTKPEEINDIFATVVNFLKDKEILSNFEILLAIKHNDIKKFKKLLKSTTIARTRRINLGKFTVMKIKNLKDAQRIYFLGIPIYYKKGA